MGEGGGNKVASCRTRNESVGSNNSWGDETSEDHQYLDMTGLTEKHDQSHAINQTEKDITLSLSNLMLSTIPDPNPSPIPPKPESPWVKIVNSYDRQQQIVQARLKVITTAKQTPVHPIPDSFTKLVPRSHQQQSRSLAEASSAVSVTMTATDFPELQRSSPPSHYDHNKTPGHRHR
jgi:hypothetical protein